MFNPFHIIDKIKQAIFMKLISLAAKAQSQGLPMIKQSAFLHQCDTTKLQACNDNPLI
jgi:hypothetical protein